MLVFNNATGSKKVRISKDATGLYNCFFIQVYKFEEQVLNSKHYSNLNLAKKWAAKQLN